MLSPAEICLPRHRVVAAFDQDNWLQAIPAHQKLKDVLAIGKYNSLADGIGVKETVKRARRYGFMPMIDLKIYDIDDTILRRTREQAAAGASLITIHAANTVKALKNAVKGVNQATERNPSLQRPWLVGVTVLTSIDDKGSETCESIFGGNRKTKVLQFGRAAADAGFDAVVCSPLEAEMLSNDPIASRLKRILPAIRPLWSVAKPDEQATATTPRIAMEAGGDLLVVGRPLINARQFGLSGPEAVGAIAEEIAKVRPGR